MSWQDILKEEPQKYYLMLEAVTKDGWEISDLDEEEVFTGTLTEAQKWAEKKFDEYADSNEQFRNYGSSAFTLYNEDGNRVHSGGEF